MKLKNSELDKTDIGKFKLECNKLFESNVEISEKIKKYEDFDIENKNKRLISLTKTLSELNSKIDIFKVDIKNKNEKVKFLDTHEYNPECEYCNKNAFVQDALKAKTELERLKPLVLGILEEKNNIQCEIDSLSDVEDGCIEYNKLTKEFQKNENEYHKCISKASEYEKQHLILETEIKELNGKIKTYYDSIETIKKNEKSK